MRGRTVGLLGVLAATGACSFDLIEAPSPATGAAVYLRLSAVPDGGVQVRGILRPRSTAVGPTTPVDDTLWVNGAPLGADVDARGQRSWGAAEPFITHASGPVEVRAPAIGGLLQDGLQLAVDVPRIGSASELVVERSGSLVVPLEGVGGDVREESGQLVEVSRSSSWSLMVRPLDGPPVLTLHGQGLEAAPIGVPAVLLPRDFREGSLVFSWRMLHRFEGGGGAYTLDLERLVGLRVPLRIVSP